MFKNKYFGLILCLRVALSYQICTNTTDFGPDTETYHVIKSDSFPDKDNNTTLCRYIFTAPEDFVISAQCVINITKDKDGNCDKQLYISRDGDANLTDADGFCGDPKIIINRTSNFNRMVIAYESETEKGKDISGSFICYIKVQRQGCECGWSKSSRIVGGEDAEVGEFPSIVGLYSDKHGGLYCGGTIISHRFVVTAWHCFKADDDIKEMFIVVGFINRVKNTQTPYTAIYDILRKFQFPGSNSRTKDIALLQTSTSIKYSLGVGPACLPFIDKNNTFVGIDANLVGWGFLHFESGKLADVLQKTTAEIITNYKCSHYFSSITKSHLCTYTKGRDACQYDSGGPVYISGKRQFLVGVISYGSDCGSHPGVNTRITTFLKWIKVISMREVGERLCYKKF